MAYMSQERKATIAADLKKVFPKGWKYSLAVRNHSTIILTLREAPMDLLGNMLETQKNLPHYEKDKGMEGQVAKGHVYVNEKHVDRSFSGKALEIMQAAADAMMKGNHDNSDIQTDYFDVGWYVDIQLGKWDAPFIGTVDTPVEEALSAETVEVIAAIMGMEEAPVQAAPKAATAKKSKPLSETSAILWEKYRPEDYATMTAPQKNMATRKAYQKFLALKAEIGIDAVIQRHLEETEATA
jgi:hypothetical protein